MECPVCYSDKASCALVCGHSFCKDCVKTWYYKCDEPSCPMCRRTLYFKGMHKVVDAWDNERAIKKNEEAFSQAFDDIFDEEDDEEFDSDDDSDVSDDESETDSWETTSEVSEMETKVEVPWKTDTRDYYSELILGEIKALQKEYQKSEELGVDFEWYHNNWFFFDIEPPGSIIIEDDVFPHFKNLFVSNHKGGLQGKRVGKRVTAKTDTSFTTVFVVVF